MAPFALNGTASGKNADDENGGIEGFADVGDGYQAAQRRAAVRRSKIQSVALYAGQIRIRSKLSAGGSQIAVPWVRPGDARRADALDSAQGKPATGRFVPHSGLS